MLKFLGGNIYTQSWEEKKKNSKEGSKDKTRKIELFRSKEMLVVEVQVASLLYRKHHLGMSRANRKKQFVTKESWVAQCFIDVVVWVIWICIFDFQFLLFALASSSRRSRSRVCVQAAYERIQFPFTATVCLISRRKTVKESCWKIKQKERFLSDLVFRLTARCNDKPEAKQHFSIVIFLIGDEEREREKLRWSAHPDTS